MRWDSIVNRARWRRGKQVVSGRAAVLSGHNKDDKNDPEYRPAIIVAGFGRPLEYRTDPK